MVLAELIGGRLSDASAHEAEAVEIESAFGYPADEAGVGSHPGVAR